MFNGGSTLLTIEPNRLDQFHRTLDRALPLVARPLDPASDRVLERARALPPRQQALLELVYRYHVPLRAVGAVLNQPPGTVSRTARRLWRRLAHPLAEDLLRPDCPLPTDTLEIAVAHFLAGRPRRHIARERRLPEAQVRDHLHHALGWHRAVRDRPRADR